MDRQYCNIGYRPAHISLRFYNKWQRVLYRAKNNERREQQLSFVLRRSLPIVYPDWWLDSNKCEADNNRFKSRVHRWKRYVTGMYNTFDALYLLTLTFSDDNYTENTTKSRKEYAQKWLKANCDDYFACMDVGEINGREHYHAVCAFNFTPIYENYTDNKNRKKTKISAPEGIAWEKGFYNIKKIRTDTSNLYRTVRYVLKTTAYTAKYAKETGIRPFHARGVKHFSDDDLSFLDELPY